MTIENDFLTFAGGSGANVLSQSAYAAQTALLANGFSSGVASSAQLNKVWRQSSIMAAVLAAFIVDQSGQPAIDDGTTATLEANLLLAIQNVQAAQLGNFVPKSGTSLTGPVNANKGNALASAATVNIGAATGEYLHITGTTTITAFDNAQAGTGRVVVFDGALTLTHNATSLILPTAANIATAAGDVARFRSEGSGNWRCVGYMRADGSVLAGSRMQVGTAVATTSGTAFLFSSLPSWAKRITLIFDGVSLSSTSHLLVQLGSGSVQSTGYVSTSISSAGGNAVNAASSTAGMVVFMSIASYAARGKMELVNMGGNVWVSSHAYGMNTSVGASGGGDVALSGALDRIYVTSNGSDTFDAGSINYIIEG